MGWTLAAIGFVLGMLDLFSVQPRWWGVYAWVLCLLGIALGLLGV